MSSPCHRRGSSLIELLVVVSIIAVLFGMLVPSLQRSVSLVRATMCQNNLKEVSLALRIYRVENEGWLPVSDSVNEVVASEDGSDSRPDVWFMKLYPEYMVNPAHLSCPEDPFGYRMKQASNLTDDPSIANFASYGINSFIMSAGRGLLAHVERFEPSRPGDTILLADLGPDYVSRGSNEGIGDIIPSRNQSLLSWGDGFDIFNGMSQPWLTDRHKRGVYVATVDGGLRHVNTRQIMSSPVQEYYEECEAGGCTLCRELFLYHYSFARRRLFWWTGELPELVASRIGS
ncbi:MAG: type II secretion system protein [Phycisphaerae bacterium]